MRVPATQGFPSITAGSDTIFGSAISLLLKILALYSGASPQSGTSRTSPSRRADWWATTPGAM